MKVYYILFLILFSHSILSNNFYRPVIGVYGVIEPIDDNTLHNKDILDTAIERWIEDMGGRVLLIPHWLSHSEYDTLLSKLNGVLFPGASRKMSLGSLWEENARYIYKYSQEHNIPLFGICRGFQLVGLFATNENKNWLDEYKDKGTHNAAFSSYTLKSRLFSLFDDKNFYELENKWTTPYIHSHGLNESNFINNEYLNENFYITLYGHDNNGKKFVNCFESKIEKGFDIYACQFHPEKVPYIRTDKYEDQHSMDSIKRSQLISLQFIEQARKNKNKFDFPQDYEKYYFVNTYKKMNEKVSFDEKILYWVFNK
jgi:imidazoleglycerol phosphate synthase glutamine amidotransferase subunit HisH